MSERIFGPKKAGTSTLANPSLVSATTPTLANPVRGFDIANKASIQTSSEVSIDLQAAQSAGEQSCESQAIEKKPVHDISCMVLRHPQAKLTVGEPGDQYEQEADRVANRVMSMPNTAVQPEMTQEEQTQEEEVQTKPSLQRATNGSLQPGENIESRLNSSKGGGSPLADEVRGFMEPRFDADFSQVRVHTDGAAVQMNQDLEAQAFTHGSDVYFGQGKSPGNNELMAHELTHVVQQKGGVLRRDVLQRTPKKQIVTELSTKLPVTQANARLIDAYYNLGSIYVDLSVVNTDLISTKLRIFSLNYDMAYSNYSRVIGQGRAEAQNQTLWRGIFLGIGTGILAGLAAAYIAPSTAGAWFALTLADAGTAAGSSFLQAAASSTIALALSDAMTTRGSDLQPGGLSPDVLRSNIWQHVASMYRGALQTNGVLANLHKNTVILERLVAEIRVQIAGGASEHSAADILTATNIMIDRINGMTSVFNELRQKTTAMSSFSNSISAYDPTKPGVDQIEKDIWIMWMGTLSNDDSDILDLDNIEDHLKNIGILGNGGLLGVDFGDYTSEDDELAALAAARPRAATIKGKYDQTASQWTAPSP
ncbi:eCIS core domain-containing protein [Nostoc sp.]|uniref:eCIS core domain-containing protein n=1 Tax=Nostoc sp. TaxID=1180 RepID=UPI002FFA59A3